MTASQLQTGATEASKQRKIGLLMAVSCAVLWGFLAIVMKVVSKDVDSMTIVWFRFCFAFVVLAMIVGIRRPASLKILRAPPRLALLGALALTGNYIGFMSGLELTTPSFAQVLIQSAPLMLAISGVVFFRERMAPHQFLGVLIAIGGFVLFYMDQYQAAVVPRSTLERGILILSGAALSWTLYAIFQKLQVSRGSRPQELNLVYYLLPTLLLWPWVNFETLAGLTPGMWCLMVLLGANTILAYGALGEALSRLPAYQVSLILTCNPLITLAALACLAPFELAWVPADSVSWVGYLAALLVVLGIAVVLKRKALKPVVAASLSKAG